MRRPKILVADDHVVFTDGIVRILGERFDVVDAVTDGYALLEAAGTLSPDVIISDISMPALSGLETLRQLKARHPNVSVILLTMHADAKMAAEAFRLGAKAYVLKQSSGDELVKAVDAVLQGHNYLSSALTEEVMSVIAGADPSNGPDLTARQTEVLRLIVNGQRMKEIAAQLNLSPRTVETIKYEIMRELDVHSTAQLVRYAIERKLVGL